MHTILMWMPGPVEIIVILLVGLLLFGRRLPEVGRSLGKSIVEFKKGIRDVEDDVSVATRSAPPSKPLPGPDQPAALPTPPPDKTPAETPAEKTEASTTE